MSLINKPYTFTVGATIVASEHNSNFDTIYSDYNGNITNDNISGSAAISDSKLAQITTPAKVAGDALTLLANIPSGAGIIPIANLPSILQATTDTRNIALASGTQAILMAGTSFTPRSAIILATVDATNKTSWGMDDGSRHYSIAASGTARNDISSDFSIRSITASGTTEYRGLFNSFNSGGGSITWTRVGGTTSGTLQLYIGFIR